LANRILHNPKISFLTHKGESCVHVAILGEGYKIQVQLQILNIGKGVDGIDQ
jgi:hypothetical protein